MENNNLVNGGSEEVFEKSAIVIALENILAKNGLLESDEELDKKFFGPNPTESNQEKLSSITKKLLSGSPEADCKDEAIKLLAVPDGVAASIIAELKATVLPLVKSNNTVAREDAVVKPSSPTTKSPLPKPIIEPKETITPKTPPTPPSKNDTYREPIT